MARYEWIIMWEDDAICERCDKCEKIPIPMSVIAFGKWSEYFIEKHKDCKENKSE